MSNHYDEESEDGELAKSPYHQDEMDFSLSDEDRDIHDTLDIKPPQAVVKSRRSTKHRDRHKHKSHREKKHAHREREQIEKSNREPNSKNVERNQDYGRDYNRDKNFYYKEKDSFRDRDIMRHEKEYRDAMIYREKHKEKLSYKEKEIYNRDRSTKHSDRIEKRSEGRTEARLRAIADGTYHSNYEKENKGKHDGDKELEDLRSRLLSKRFSGSKDSSSKYDDVSDSDGKSKQALDKSQHERRKRLLEADKEMEKRKQMSRSELEERRERRRDEKRTALRSPVVKKARSAISQPEQQELLSSEPVVEDAVIISDVSDVEMKEHSDNESEQEDGEHSKSGSSSSSSTSSDSSETNSDTDTNSDGDGSPVKLDEEIKKNGQVKNDEKDRSKSPIDGKKQTPLSSHSKDGSNRSRSRSHSFSPPPPGSKDEEKPNTQEDEQLNDIGSLPPYFPALQGCRSVEEFQCLNRIEEGTYGVVYRARDKTTNEIVALKRLKMEKEREGFPITSLREINTLLKGQHPNIVTVREIVVGSNMDKIFIVMDYVEHDLKSLMETMRNKKQVFLPGEVKCLMIQLLRAVFHLHDNWILHRDLKTSNLLLSHKGVLKVGDFGLAREYGSPLRQYTPVVVTLWYRAPELLLCTKEYSTPIDIWSVGCIFAEFVTMHPLFPGKSEVDQLNKIFKDLGTPSEEIWEGYKQLPAVQKMTFADYQSGGLKQKIGSDLLSEMGHTLLNSFLTYDPKRRITADAALAHAYFKEQPLAIDPAMFPTWPAKSEGGRRTTAHSPKPPAGGAQQAKDDDDSLGFHMPKEIQQPQRSLNIAPGFALKF